MKRYEDQGAAAVKKGEVGTLEVEAISTQGNTSDFPDCIRMDAKGESVNVDVTRPHVPSGDDQRLPLPANGERQR